MALKDFALKVSLTVRKPQLTAKDDKATNDAEVANNAHNAGAYRKELYPKALLAGIQEAESAARSFLARRSIEGVIPSVKFMEFANDFAKYELSFNQAVTVFMQNYSNVLIAAQQSQGAMFDANLYPDMASLRARFSWEVNYEPITDHSLFGQILGQMEAPAAAQLTASITRQMAAEQDSITSTAINRLKEVVAHMAVAVTRPDRVVTAKNGALEKRPPIFRASMVENIVEITGLLEQYSAALPANLSALVTQAKVLTTHKAETLRDDPDMRKTMGENAKALLADIDVLMGYSPPVITVIAPTTPAPVPTDPAMQMELLPEPPAEIILTPDPIPVEEKVAVLSALDELEAKITNATGLPTTPVPKAWVEKKAPKEYDMGGLFAALDEMED
jgi:hypothetical protein